MLKRCIPRPFGWFWDPKSRKNRSNGEPFGKAKLFWSLLPSFELSEGVAPLSRTRTDMTVLPLACARRGQCFDDRKMANSPNGSTVAGLRLGKFEDFQNSIEIVNRS